MNTLTSAQLDRACGTVLASAAGDALGAPYEFDLAKPGNDGPQMIGGVLGDFEPGEWTDDTTMAWCVLDAAAAHGTLLETAALDEVACNFKDWVQVGPKDIGNQTGTVIRNAEPTAASMTATAAELHARTGHTAGNGSLMRTGPVPLPHLHDADAVVAAAAAVSDLTHADPRAQQACVLWSLAIRHAILHGEFDVRSGLAHLDPSDATYWSERIDEAEAGPPERFRPNGWTVTALQAAWSTIVHTPATGCEHLQTALARAIGIGHDTDTVAAIAGALLGARWGASAVPARWRRILHGYPGISGEHLVERAHLATSLPNGYGWPGTTYIDYSDRATGISVRHPHDAGVWLGDALTVSHPPSDVTAVVSLCLLGSEQVPSGLEHVPFRLLDAPDAASNPNLDFVLADAARTVAALRDEGQVVLLHCAAARSRTPSVAAAYSMLRGVPRDTAVADVQRALPTSNPNPAFVAALKRLASANTST